MRPIRVPTALLAGLLVTCLAVAPASAARLATDVVPTFQSIELKLDPSLKDYSGSIRAELSVKKSTRTVQLHSQGQKLESVTLTQGGKAIPVTREYGDRGLLTLNAETPLAPGAAALEIRFTHVYNTQAVSLYKTEKGGQGYLFSQMQADHAREAFPCWDEPGFKIPWQFTLKVPVGQEALCNTPVEKETTADGWRTIVFRKSPPLPSYLLAIAAGTFEYVPIPGCGVPARVVTIKGQSHLAGYAVEVTPRTLRGLEAYFERPYPYEKLDLIAVPEFWAGAMENAGAITYRDQILLIDPKAASTYQRKDLLRVNTHELAHMWFGDLVTLSWWDDMWLNESFADWLGDKFVDQLFPEFKHGLDELQDIQQIMKADARPSTEAIRIRAETGDDAMRAVGVAYNKGKAVLGMFEHWIGPEKFRKGIVSYIKAHEWGSAEAKDLWLALEKSSGKDVTAMMEGYVDQNGLPLVTVEPTEGGIRLSQRRLLDYGVQSEARTWRIPMTIRYSDGATVKTAQTVLEAEPQILRLEGAAKLAWVMPNAGARGYYRWDVPGDMLMKLAADADRLMDPAERIAFLGNLQALLDAGELHGDEYLRLLGEMASDPEPLVASSVIASLGEVRLSFVPDDLRPAFAAYVRRTLSPMAERFGLEKKKGEEEAVSLLRPQLLAWMGREGRDPATLAYADQVAAKFMADPTSVDPALAGTALQLHAMRGDRALFDRYRTAAEEAKVPAVRQRYIGALGHFEDPAIEEAALQYAIDGPLRPTEWGVIPLSVGQRSDRHADRTFAWFRQNYDKLAGRVPPAYRTFFANYGGGCSAERLSIAQSFFGDPSRTVQGMDKQLQKVAERVHGCIGLREREGAGVSAYLKGLTASP